VANPYAAPESTAVPPGETSVEHERRTHRTHEARVKGLGWALVMQGVARVLGGLLPAMAALGEQDGPDPAVASVFLTVALTLMGVGALTIAAGVGVHLLRRWGWHMGVLACVVGLVYVPMGTVLSLWGAALLLAPKGRRVFRQDYAAIQSATRHVEWQPKPLPGLIVGFLMVGALVGCVVALARLGMLAA
jgi:hypothetical protein